MSFACESGYLCWNMICRFRISFLLLLLALAMTQVYAQTLPLEAHFNRYTMEDGLPDNNVICMAQDDQGFLWLGTEVGLSCFDGVHFTNYFKGDDPQNSLSSNYIVRLVKLPDGKIAIGTKLGVSLLDPVRRTFRSRLVPCEPEMLFAQNAIGSMVVTASGNILAGSNAGVCVFDTALNVVFQYSHFKKEDVGKGRMGFAHDLMPLDNGDALIRGWNGFWRYHDRLHKVEKQEAGAFGETMWETFSSAGNSHIAIWQVGFPDSLNVHDLRKGKAATTQLTDEIKYEIHWRTSLRFVNDTLMGFAGCNTGFRTAICDPTNLLLRFSKNRIFTDQHFNAFLLDREGRWWLASENGLFVQSFSKGLFRFVPLKPAIGPDSIPQNITGMTKLDGHFYVGQVTKILELDSKLKILKSIDYPYPYSQVWGLAQWQPGILDIWSDTGWKRLPIQKGWRSPPAWLPIGPASATQSQWMDRRGEIWTGTGTGLIRYNPVTKQATLFGGDEQVGGFPRQGALKIIETDSGYLWMCGIPGFTRWNPFTQTFDRHFKQAPGTEEQEGYPSAMVSNGGEEILFVLYGNGLWKWQGNQQPAQRISTGNPNLEFVKDIFPDPRPYHYWLMLKSGIAILDVATGKYRFLSTANGLPDKTVKIDLYLDRPTDSIYICYENGIVVANRKSFDFSEKACPIFISGIQQLSTGLMLDAAARLNLEQPTQDIAISFSSPDYEHGSLLTYAYRLNGGDWQSLGTSKSVRFINLSSGKYHFEVKSITPEGVASEPAALYFCVKPFYYQTWWFITLLAAAFGLAVFGYFRWRIAQLRKMEAMRQSIAADLHDEVGASLTSIQILSQLASHPDSNRSKEALEKLPEQVRHTSASLREIVWNIQPKHDDLNLLISELTRHAGEFFEKMDIQYTVQADEFPETATLDVALRQHLLRIFKESLNNIAKHSRAGRAAVFFKMLKKELVLTVRDDGQGFDAAAMRRGNGLNNMEHRAIAVGGSFSLRSKIGEGTEITLKLPLQLKSAWWRLW